jgi:uncharacterized protein
MSQHHQNEQSEPSESMPSESMQSRTSEASQGASVGSDTERERLLATIARHRRVVVAYSGGVDSTLVAWAAHRALGDGALAVIGLSPSLAERDHARAVQVAGEIGIRYREIETREIDLSGYRANAGDRCYYCKSELYDRLEAVRGEEGAEAILDGTNLDDFDDTRPGLTAAREHRVVSPLVEAGLDKQAVRRLSHAAGLPTWDLPENACLASRLPVGSVVSIERLRRVEQAEDALRDLGFRQVRVRDEGEQGRIEIAAEELARALESATAARIESAVRAAGFARAFIDPEGYRRGGADRRGAGGTDRDG